MDPLDALAALQRPDGSWCAPPDAGAFTTALSLLALDRMGALQADEAAAMARALLARVRSDGTVPAYPGGPRGSVPATALVSAALQVAGIDAVAMPDRLDPITAVICGRVDRRVPLSTSALALPVVRRFLSRLLGFNALMGAHLLLPLVHPPRTRAGRRAVVRYLLDHQDTNGSWASIAALTALGLLSLSACGQTGDQPGPTRAIQYLRGLSVERLGGIDVAPFDPSVWDTARSVRALARAGRDVGAGVDWLLSVRCVRDAPADWQTTRPGAPTCGGWSFGAGGQLTPDTDTTALVLDALVAAGVSGDPIDEATAWLWGMQNHDGGWAAFTWGQPTKPVGPLGTRPPGPPTSVRGLPRWWRGLRAELGDPSTAELTGRVLSTLGALGHDWRDDRVAHAVDFLRRQQWRGAWWGRWSTGYAAATADVLAGLSEVGVDRRLPWIRVAVDQLCAWQHEDGGWGEDPLTYADPDLAGAGPSNAFHTGEVVDALCRVDGRTAAADRGAAWLRANLGPDGRWPDDALIGVIQPPWGFNTLPTTIHCAGIEGLAIAASALAREPAGHELDWPLPPGAVRWSFRHLLRFDAPIGAVYDALHDIESWESWWPGLGVEVQIEGDERGVGRVGSVRFDTPLGYALGTRFSTVLADRPHRIIGFVEGDLEGIAVFELSGSDGSTTLRYRWEVATTRTWMNRVARRGRRVLLWNHDRVMERFGRGLAEHLGAELLELRLEEASIPG